MKIIKEQVKKVVKEYFSKEREYEASIKVSIWQVFDYYSILKEDEDNLLDYFYNLLEKTYKVKFTEENKKEIIEYHILDDLYYNIFEDYLMGVVLKELRKFYEEKILDEIYYHNEDLLSYIDITIDNVDYSDASIIVNLHFSVIEKDIDALIDEIMDRYPDMIDEDNDGNEILDKGCLWGYLNDDLDDIVNEIEENEYLNKLLNDIFMNDLVVDFNDDEFKELLNDEIPDNNFMNYLEDYKNDEIEFLQEKIDKIEDIKVDTQN